MGIDHTPVFEKVLSYHFESGEAGPRLLILGGIHGNETCGQVALNTLKAELEGGRVKLLKGSLTLVPHANPWACAADVRYVEKNLNRVIGHHKNPEAYEERIAPQIATLIDQCDAMVDLHSVSSGCPEPFVFNDYPNTGNDGLSRVLGGHYIVGGWAEMFDDPTHEDQTTQAYAQRVGKVGTLIECGNHTEPAAAKVALRAATNAMKYFGLMSGDIITPQLKDDVKITGVHVKSREGQLSDPSFYHMQPITKGQHIATYENGEKLHAPADGYLLLPFHAAKVGDEWFCYGIRR